MGCSVGFKYAKNALAAGAPLWTSLGELTLPPTSYSLVGGGQGAMPPKPWIKKLKLSCRVTHRPYRRACSHCH